MNPYPMSAPRRRRPLALCFMEWLLRCPAVRRGSGPGLAPGAAAEVLEDLVEDGEALEGGRLVDGERRLEPDVRRVGHGEQATLHALAVHLLHERAVERLLRLAVLHQLH